MPSVKTNFSLDYSDMERIRESILRCGNTSENVINNYLHNVGGPNITKSITKFIPRSNRNKVHAKNSNWSEQANFNLAVNISNSLKGKRGSSFYYLYYVVTGTGTSKNRGPNDFMEKGLNQEYNDVVDGLINELNQNIEKELKV